MNQPIWSSVWFGIIAIIIFGVHDVNCQGWAWLAGEQIVDQVSTRQYPGGQSGASTWHDVHTNVTWMFGGRGFSDLPSGKPHLLNDLWQFSPRMEEKGRKMYFLKHSPSVFAMNKEKISNHENSPWPGSRHHASMCGFSDMLVIFGGLGEMSNTLDDLWVYNFSAKTWTQVFKEGPAARGHPSVWCVASFMYIFGGVGNKQQIFNDMWKLNLLTLEWTLLQASRADEEFLSEAYLPQGRNGAATWISDDALYMFGGNTDSSFSYSLQHSGGLTSGLWRYFLCNSTWDHVYDPLKNNPNGVHISTSKNVAINGPSPRLGAGSWVDSSGNLWLFGGAGVASHSVSTNKLSQVLPDIWHFDIKLKTWAFIGGSTEGGKAGKYKSLGKKTGDGMPGARTEMMIFPGSCDEAFIFGGIGHDARQVDGYLNDLWSVDVSSIVSGKYGISAWSLLLFLSICVSLLVFILVFGLWYRNPKRYVTKWSTDTVRFRASDNQYSLLKTDENDF